MRTNQLSVLLVDHDSQNTANLNCLIEANCPSLQVIGSAISVGEALEKITQKKPDVIFLDLSVPMQNGFDFIKLLTQNPLVVFLGSVEQISINTLKAYSVDFLLKPIVIDHLIKTETKLLEIIGITRENRSNKDPVINCPSNIAGLNCINNIKLYCNNGYKIFAIEEILYLSAQDNYTVFHFRDQKTIMVTKTMKYYEEILNPMGFIRIHKSTLVNLFHVKKVLKNGSINIVLTNAQKLHVSRRKGIELLDWNQARTNSL